MLCWGLMLPLCLIVAVTCKGTQVGAQPWQRSPTILDFYMIHCVKGSTRRKLQRRLQHEECLEQQAPRETAAHLAARHRKSTARTWISGQSHAKPGYQSGRIDIDNRVYGTGKSVWCALVGLVGGVTHARRHPAYFRVIRHDAEPRS